MVLVRQLPSHVGVCDLQEGIKCIIGDGSDPTSHTLTGSGEAQNFLLITHHNTAGSPILPRLNCSVLLPVVIFLVKTFWFFSHKDFAGEMWGQLPI